MQRQCYGTHEHYGCHKRFRVRGSPPVRPVVFLYDNVFFRPEHKDKSLILDINEFPTGTRKLKPTSCAEYVDTAPLTDGRRLNLSSASGYPVPPGGRALSRLSLDRLTSRPAALTLERVSSESHVSIVHSNRHTPILALLYPYFLQRRHARGNERGLVRHYDDRRTFFLAFFCIGFPRTRRPGHDNATRVAFSSLRLSLSLSLTRWSETQKYAGLTRPPYLLAPPFDKWVSSQSRLYNPSPFKLAV